jgi:16S rRNA processing protein RimM
MDINTCYKIGYILKPHGLKGEVTMSLEVDAPDFEGVESVFVESNNRLAPFFIEAVSVRGSKAFVKFEDVNTPEGAQAISKSAVYLPKASRARSARGEFYDDEVVGFEVTDSEAGLIGKVQEVTSAGPNKLLSVDYNGKEVLIPINGPFITSINKSKKKISVSLPEGFLDL